MSTRAFKARLKFITGLVLLAFAAPAASADQDIRLVLQLTVDGLRADLLERYSERFSAGGFQRLMSSGVYYANAHYQHANTETIVGHATLATGAQPSRHGMTGNVWFDAASGELSYNIEDPQAPLLPTREEQISGEQVDPAQLLARTSGRSPRALLAETFTDRLHAYSGGHSRIYAVSGKDRGAVALAGHSGKAFWYSTDNGDFVTSSYYYESYPGWAATWNAKRKAEEHANTEWSLLNEQSSYLLRDQDDRPYETDLRGFGRTFPHAFGGAGNKLLYTQVLASPVGDRLAADFALALLAGENLGSSSTPDYLSVSFSGLDAVDHFFGPSSLENEDMMLQLDQTLAHFLNSLDQQLGLDKVLIVLSADHGMPEAPEYMSERGLDAGRLTTDQVMEQARSALETAFGNSDLVSNYFRPYLYLDEDVLASSGLNRHQVAAYLADSLTALQGIHLAVAVEDIASIRDPSLRTRIQNNTHPERSGDIYLVQAPYWFNFDAGPVAVMHGSPWRYDTHVPILFSRAGLKSTRVERQVQPADVAPTLSAILGMTPPASAQGTVLVEVLEKP